MAAVIGGAVALVVVAAIAVVPLSRASSGTPEQLPVDNARVHINLFSGRSNPVVRIAPEQAGELWSALEGLEETSAVFEWYDGLGFRGFIVTAEDPNGHQVAVEVRPGDVLVTRITSEGAHENHLVDLDDSMMYEVADLVDDHVEDLGVREVLEPWFS